MHGCGRGPIDLKSIHCALGRWSALGKLALLAKEQSHGDLGGVIRAVGTRSGVCTALVHVFRPCTHPQNSAAHCDRPSTFLVLGAWSWWGWKHTTEQRVPSNPFLPCAKLSMRSIARRCGSIGGGSLWSDAGWETGATEQRWTAAAGRSPALEKDSRRSVAGELSVDQALQDGDSEVPPRAQVQRGKRARQWCARKISGRLRDTSIRRICCRCCKGAWAGGDGGTTVGSHRRLLPVHTQR